MRTTFKIICLVLLTFGAAQIHASADVTTNVTYLRILAEGNNASNIIQTLPEVDALYRENPNAYLKSANQALAGLSSNLKDALAKTTFLNLFTNVLLKPCPTNETQAVSWVVAKRDMILFYVNFNEIRNDKAQWIAIAKFAGELRSKMIPKYVNQATTISGIGNMATSQVELQRLITENETKKTTDNFQMELDQTQNALIGILEYGCPYTQPGQPTDTNFLARIISESHLTPEESQLLNRH